MKIKTEHIDLETANQYCEKRSSCVNCPLCFGVHKGCIALYLMYLEEYKNFISKHKEIDLKDFTPIFKEIDL